MAFNFYILYKRLFETVVSIYFVGYWRVCRSRDKEAKATANARESDSKRCR